MDNETDLERVQIRTLAEAYLDRLAHFMQWSSAVAAGAAVWAADRMDRVPPQNRTFMWMGIGLLLLSLLTGLSIGFLALLNWRVRRRLIESERTLNLRSEAIMKMYSPGKPADEDVVDILNESREQYSRNQKVASILFRFITSDITLGIHLSTLFLGIFTLMVSQSPYSGNYLPTLMSPLSP